MDEDQFWRLVLQNWRRAVALDLHQHYGIDTDGPQFWDRPFYWLRERVLGLLDLPDTRLWHLVLLARTEQESGTGAPA